MHDESNADTDLKSFLGFTLQAFNFKPERGSKIDEISRLLPSSRETDFGHSSGEPQHMMNRTLNDNMFPKRGLVSPRVPPDDGTLSKESFDQNFKIFKKFKDFQKSSPKPRTVTTSPSR